MMELCNYFLENNPAMARLGESPVVFLVLANLVLPSNLRARCFRSEHEVLTMISNPVLDWRSVEFSQN